MHTLRPSRIALALVLTLSLGTRVKAQTQTDASPSAAAQQPVITLDPFTVDTSNDTGYIATDSLAGGRYAAPIRTTPAPMSTITSQFLTDLQLTSVNDVLKWSLNTVPTSDRSGLTGGSGGGVFNYWSISSRGGQTVQGGNPPTRNYFPTFVNEDTYDIERIEFDEGPNSILFGIGDIGGSVNAYTKTARFDKNFEDVEAEYNSYGGYRFTVDSNQAVGNLAVRVNAVFANEQGFRDGDFHHKLGATLAATYKFNNDTSQLRLEVQGWDEKKAIYGATYQDNVSLWDGKTTAATWGASIANLGANPQTTAGAPGVTGMSDWGLSPNYNVLVPGEGIMNWSGGVRTMGTNNIAWGAYLRPDSFSYAPTGGTEIMALPSRNFAAAPQDGYLRPQAGDITLTFDQKITDNMDLELSAYHYVDAQYSINFEGAYSVSRDLNQQLPNGQPNPNFKQLYSDYFLDKQVQDHSVNEVRGQFSYHFDTKLWDVSLKQVFSISAGQQITDYNAGQYNADDTQVDPTQQNWTSNNWTEDMVWARIYWNNNTPTLNVPAYVKYQPMPFNWYDFDSKQTVKYGAGFGQTRLWDDRLNLTYGYRQDSYDVSKIGLRGPSNTPVTGSGSGNTYSVGAIGYVTEWLGVFGNVSTNYTPAGGGLAPSLTGQVRGASKGKGENVGARISTKDGKYYVSFTYYKDTASDVIGGDDPGFQNIWNDYLLAGGTATDIGPAGQINGKTAQMQYNTIYDVRYTGVEFEAVANPTKNIRLQIHYAAPKGERFNDGVDGLAYFNAHLSEWQAAAAANTAASQKLASDLTMASNNYAVWEVPTLAGAVERYHFNAFADYNFTDSDLKGLDLGFGATETGARQIDQVNRTSAYTIESALIGYERTLNTFGRNINWRFQINVDNLFGNNTLVFQSFNGTTPMDYNFIPPRKFTFSASMRF
jgi:outer membrane receptor protein involved in Fe transport